MKNINKINKAKIWFRNLFNHCYQIKKDLYHIYWVYDTTRKCKLDRILGKKNNLPYKKEIIFRQDLKNHYFWIEYHGYWRFLKENFELSYDEVKELTKDEVNFILNSKQYTTQCSELYYLQGKLHLKW